MDITAIMLSAVIFMFVFSAARGQTRYVPLGFGAFLAVLAVYYAWSSSEPLFYGLAAIAIAKGLYTYKRWRK